METVNIVIIGAGVVGLAIAEELSKKYKEIVVLEKHNSFGQETSSRNSEVIHAGIYYPKDTLKAKLCVEGRALLYEICQKYNIPFKKIGKLIVASEEDEIPPLEELFKKGKDNGVDDLRLINIGDLKKMEPNVNGVVALYSPSTGIVNSHRLMQYFSDTAQSNGVTISYGSEVIDIKKCVNDYEVAVKNNNEVCSLNTKIVINSAGLDSDRIAEMVGIDIDRSNYKLHYCKGQYFRVNHSKSHLIKRLIYPVPKPKSAGLGVHATLDLSGGIRLGPDGRYLKNRIEEYSVDDSQKNSFFVAANRLLPFIHKDDLYADTAGIRPKLQKEGDDFKDFIIREETDKEFRGFINLIGIESPGLTASSAIAKFVLLLLDNLC
ncbi:MAG TPA: NAD(P)/FAD-dependent oxidoreductase [Candidatus Omnitrophica bacterium]|nr:NAD(P)/FAD-dependent oxidoreductase [Candidatus Omnitrophota bacterium]